MGQTGGPAWRRNRRGRHIEELEDEAEILDGIISSASVEIAPGLTDDELLNFNPIFTLDSGARATLIQEPPKTTDAEKDIDEYLESNPANQSDLSALRGNGVSDSEEEVETMHPSAPSQQGTATSSSMEPTNPALHSVEPKPEPMDGRGRRMPLRP